MRKWLVLDCETGGLDPSRHAILSIGAVALDPSSGDLAGLELLIADPEGECDPVALAIHGIDPRRVAWGGLQPCKTVQKLEGFLAAHFPQAGRITVAGYNVAFDLAFLKRLYTLAGVDFHARYSHRVVDLHSVYATMEAAGVLPTPGERSLHGIAAVLGIEPHQPPHSALADALTTARCLHAIVTRLARATHALDAVAHWSRTCHSQNLSQLDRLLWAARVEGGAAALTPILGPSPRLLEAQESARKVTMEHICNERVKP